MLGKLLTPFTTARASGVAFRDVFQAIMVIIGLLSTLGALTPEQAASIRQIVDEITGQWPAIVAAFTTLAWLTMLIYRALTKSSSDPAAAVAKEADDIIAGKQKDATVKTPAGIPDLEVKAKVSGR